jgi:ABC-type lipoprotein export system ATPase subunit
MLVQDLSGKRDKKYALELLERVGLKGLEDRFPSQMSGGQRQRVAIARALSSRPKMMLGDELTGNLDSETSIQVLETLIDICRKEGMTVLFVTHDRSLTKYATRVLQLESGKIIGDEIGGLSTISGQVETVAKDVISGAKKIAGKILEFADEVIG